MGPHQIVIDTNVVIAALRSRRGAAHRLLRLVDSGQFELNLSVPLVLEYEAVARRLIGQIPLTETEIQDVIDYLCAIAHHQQVFYLWRPFLRDPKDDMVLELAVAAHCHLIVSFNKHDFRGVEQFGIQVVTPQEFLVQVGELP